MIKFDYLKTALDALDNEWDFTLNTDASYESARDREKILERHYIHNEIGGHKRSEEFYGALDAYLALRKACDEIESCEMDHAALHIDKSKPFSFWIGD